MQPYNTNPKYMLTRQCEKCFCLLHAKEWEENKHYCETCKRKRDNDEQLQKNVLC